MLDVLVVLVVVDHRSGDVRARTNGMRVGAIFARPNAGERPQRAKLHERVFVALGLGIDVRPVAVGSLRTVHVAARYPFAPFAAR